MGIGCRRTKLARHSRSFDMPKLPSIAALALISAPALAQEQAEPATTIPEGTAPATATDGDLAAKVANPVASLISVPFQNNLDCCYGERDAVRYTLNVQPVVPVALGDKASVIIRTIIPFVAMESPAPGVRPATDFGDVTQSFFFTPKSRGGLTWAVGPVLLWPFGGSGFGSGKWGAGPTVLVLKQSASGITVGVLASHLWSYAGKPDRDDISNTALQPFFTKTFKDATSIGLNTETNYDWVHKQWTVPINLTLGKLMKIGKQPMQLSGTARYYAVSPEDGPTWGARLTFTFLFPG
jgi:hypothetical protein